MHIFPLSMCILSTTWFGVAPPLLQPFLGQSCRGILHWESFLENLGRWITGNPPVWSVGFLVSWYPRWMATRWVSPKQNEQHCTIGRGGNQQKTPMICWKWTHVQKPTFQRFLSCFWGRPKIPSRKVKHKKAILKSISGRSEKHLTWNPGYFYAVESTTS